MGPLPYVSIVMPVRNEANYIERSLRMVLNQDYEPHSFEVLVADGLSTDGTRECIRQMQETHANLRLIDNPRKIVPTGLNAAIQQAGGDVIIRIDGHAIVETDYVSQCISWLEKSGADCVGGAVESKGQGTIGEAIALAMSSSFGVGGSGFRVAAADAKPVLTDTVPFGAYRRDVFDRVGLFNEKMVRHQDYEFCYRLRQAGGKILLLPQVRAEYYVRSSLKALGRQYWQYGIWKGRFVRAHPDSLKVRHLVPPLFVLAMAITFFLSLLISSLFLIFFGIIGMYMLFVLLASLKLSQHSSWRFVPILPIVFIILHISWGTGVWIGLSSAKKITN